MTETETENICRLCLGSEDLIWIFDDIMASNMTEIIQVTCGVEIQITDRVSQKVCSSCCKLTTKMYEFRIGTIENDKRLKVLLLQRELNRLLNGRSINNEERLSSYKMKSWTNAYKSSSKRTHSKPILHKVHDGRPSDPYPKISAKFTSSFPNSQSSEHRTQNTTSTQNRQFRSSFETSKQSSSKNCDREVNTDPIYSKIVPCEVTLERLRDNPRKSTLNPSGKATFTDTISPLQQDVNFNPTFSPSRPADTSIVQSPLLSQKSRAHTLFQCKACDSYHLSHRELRIHEKRTHTTCPFCSTKFRSMASRDEHMNTDCAIGETHQRQQDMRLLLTRVDEIPEIREKYPEVFRRDEGGPRKNNPVILANAAKGITDSNVRHHSCKIGGGDKETVFAESLDPVSEECSDVIYISDDDALEYTNIIYSKDPAIKVVNRNFSKGVSFEDDDFVVINTVFVDNSRVRYADVRNFLSGNIIEEDGTIGKTIIFKGLYKPTQYNILIEIEYSEKFQASFIDIGLPKLYKVFDLWHKIIPRDLDTSVSPRMTDILGSESQTALGLPMSMHPIARSILGCIDLTSPPRLS